MLIDRRVPNLPSGVERTLVPGKARWPVLPHYLWRPKKC